MLRVDQVYVVRHKVLVEGRGVRTVAREMGISRNTVRRYLERPQPVRMEKSPRGRPVGDAVIPRIEASLADSPRWTGGKQRLSATRLQEMRRAAADRIRQSEVRSPPYARRVGARDDGAIHGARLALSLRALLLPSGNRA